MQHLLYNYILHIYYLLFINILKFFFIIIKKINLNFILNFINIQTQLLVRFLAVYQIKSHAPPFIINLHQFLSGWFLRTYFQGRIFARLLVCFIKKKTYNIHSWQHRLKRYLIFVDSYAFISQCQLYIIICFRHKCSFLFVIF